MNITQHNFYGLYPAEARSQLDEVWKSPGLFFDLEPVMGALEGVELMSESCDVLICSKPFTDNPSCEQEKKLWLRKYLGREWAKRLCLIADKTRLRGDFLIDDHATPELVGDRPGEFKPEWEHVVYTRPWNFNVTGKRRLTWSDWRQVLPELTG
jgi:5'(3')-deoxyribonucleotidase